MTEFDLFNKDLATHTFKDGDSLQARTINAMIATLAELIQDRGAISDRIASLEDTKLVLLATRARRGVIQIRPSQSVSIGEWLIEQNAEGWFTSSNDVGAGSPQVPANTPAAFYEIRFKALVICNGGAQPPRVKVAINVAGEEYAIAEANMNAQGLDNSYRLTMGTWLDTRLVAGNAITVTVSYWNDGTDDVATILPDRNTMLSIKRVPQGPKGAANA